MKNLTLLGMVQTALVLGGCVSNARGIERSSARVFEPRIIEFKSDAMGFDTKNYFYETAQEVVAIDAQFTPDLAKQSIAHLRKFTQKPITWLVITHPNPDKFNGAQVFADEGAKVIASQATIEAMEGVHAYKKYYFVNIAKMFTEESYPQLRPVDESFDDEMTLRLSGGDLLLLKELSRAAVSSNQTVVYAPKVRSLFVGDLIHFNAHAWLEGGIVKGEATPALESWIKILNDLQKLYPVTTTVYGGRGIEARLNVAVKEQIAYLIKAEKIVSDFVVGLGDKKSELRGDKAGEHYAALAKIFEREFPAYDLSYMIQYGIYGLVNQVVADFNH